MKKQKRVLPEKPQTTTRNQVSKKAAIEGVLRKIISSDPPANQSCDGLEDLVREYMKGTDPDQTPGVPMKAIILPHYKNRRQSADGEWILTAILDSSGRVLEENRSSLGIYPNKSTADKEIAAYLRKNGSESPELEYIHIPESTWLEVARIGKMASGEDFVWTIFARSKSNDDLLKYIANVDLSLNKTKARSRQRERKRQPCNMKRLHEMLKVLHDKHYLETIRVPTAMVTLVNGEAPFRPADAEIVVYDTEKIADGMRTGDDDAFLAEASSGLSEILNDVYGLDAGWCNDRQLFDTLLKRATTQWKQETLDPETRMGLISEIADHFCDYAVNIALQIWFVKMREAHGLSPLWK